MNEAKGLQVLVVTCNGTVTRISSENLFVSAATVEPHQDNDTAIAYIGDEDLTLSNKDGALCDANTPVSLRPPNGDYINLKNVWIAGTNTEKFVVSYWERSVES